MMMVDGHRPSIDGLNYVMANMPDVHVAYIENVAEGADSEQVFRALARKGFDLIFGGSFGYMDGYGSSCCRIPRYHLHSYYRL